MKSDYAVILYLFLTFRAFNVICVRVENDFVQGELIKLKYDYGEIQTIKLSKDGTSEYIPKISESRTRFTLYRPEDLLGVKYPYHSTHLKNLHSPKNIEESYYDQPSNYDEYHKTHQQEQYHANDTCLSSAKLTTVKPTFDASSFRTLDSKSPRNNRPPRHGEPPPHDSPLLYNGKSPHDIQPYHAPPVSKGPPKYDEPPKYGRPPPHGRPPPYGEPPPHGRPPPHRGPPPHDEAPLYDEPPRYGRPPPHGRPPPYGGPPPHDEPPLYDEPPKYGRPSPHGRPPPYGGPPAHDEPPLHDEPPTYRRPPTHGRMSFDGGPSSHERPPPPYGVPPYRDEPSPRDGPPIHSGPSPHDGKRPPLESTPNHGEPPRQQDLSPFSERSYDDPPLQGEPSPNYDEILHQEEPTRSSEQSRYDEPSHYSGSSSNNRQFSNGEVLWPDRPNADELYSSRQGPLCDGPNPCYGQLSLDKPLHSDKQSSNKKQHEQSNPQRLPSEENLRLSNRYLDGELSDMSQKSLINTTVIYNNHLFQNTSAITLDTNTDKNNVPSFSYFNNDSNINKTSDRVTLRKTLSQPVQTPYRPPLILFQAQPVKPANEIEYGNNYIIHLVDVK